MIFFRNEQYQHDAVGKQPEGTAAGFSVNSSRHMTLPHDAVGKQPEGTEAGFSVDSSRHMTLPRNFQSQKYAVNERRENGDLIFSVNLGQMALPAPDRPSKNKKRHPGNWMCRKDKEVLRSSSSTDEQSLSDKAIFAARRLLKPDTDV